MSKNVFSPISESIFPWICLISFLSIQAFQYATVSHSLMTIYSPGSFTLDKVPLEIKPFCFFA